MLRISDKTILEINNLEPIPSLFNFFCFRVKVKNYLFIDKYLEIVRFASSFLIKTMKSIPYVVLRRICIWLLSNRPRIFSQIQLIFRFPLPFVRKFLKQFCSLKTMKNLFSKTKLWGCNCNFKRRKNDRNV